MLPGASVGHRQRVVESNITKRHRLGAISNREQAMYLRGIAGRGAGQRWTDSNREGFRL